MATYGAAKRSHTMLEYLKELAINGRLIYAEIGIKNYWTINMRSGLQVVVS